MSRRRANLGPGNDLLEQAVKQAQVQQPQAQQVQLIRTLVHNAFEYVGVESVDGGHHVKFARPCDNGAELLVFPLSDLGRDKLLTDLEATKPKAEPEHHGRRVYHEAE